MRRRAFLGKLGTGAAALAAASTVPRLLDGAPHIARGDLARRVIILGIDGMDPTLLSRYVAEGAMPHFARFIERHHFGTLRTTMPPQSPVAWSSFISGMNPGGHGIFDFIHRDPSTLAPYLSTSFTEGPSHSVGLGKWQIPLGSGTVELLRKGPAFWTLLEERGIPATLFKLPANFPPLECHSRTLSGLGTPDVLGTYGTFSYFTDAEVAGAADFTGGRVFPVEVRRDVVEASLVGPESFARDGAHATIPFRVVRDPRHDVARISLEGQELVLGQGEWSAWIPLSFDLLPHLASMPAMAQFYMQEVHPHFRLYVSPVNIDPMDPALPICTPEGYSRELAEAIGRYGTKGFPEETKALSHGVFTDPEYLVQADGVLEERLRAYRYELGHFDEGLFFFYFSSIDQNSHMMWRTMDPSHPLYEPAASDRVKQAVRHYYVAMDAVLAQAIEHTDAHTSLMIVSDHGFAPFTREFNLSTWLVENGYAALRDPDRQGDGEYFSNVDWTRTRAYALGLNGLYLNVMNREPHGTVRRSAMPDLAHEIAARLEAYRDPLDGRPVVTRAAVSREVFSGAELDIAPDLVVGYNRGYRISDEAVLGTYPREVVRFRKDKWAADHCIDPRHVPGVFLTNRPVAAGSPGIEDMAPTILRSFGVEPSGAMDGRDVLERRSA
ncbi:MAG: alkaline phosphatase family protein [Candidatus Eiseniibacteriota bacterium]|jgi:predicted AlkP superfamily phosphohydrolase/phosphomutase